MFTFELQESHHYTAPKERRLTANKELETGLPAVWILSKTLALRLTEVMAEVIHVNQTYCVPGRLISDNITLIWHVLEVSSSLAIDTGLISIDQEKAFDRVEHKYLW